MNERDYDDPLRFWEGLMIWTPVGALLWTLILIAIL
jgi:hypothetical protein